MLLAHQLGYKVLTKNGQTWFCGTSAPTASHIVPPCMTEAAWEFNRLELSGIPLTAIGGDSGRSPYEGTLGH